MLKGKNTLKVLVSCLALLLAFGCVAAAEEAAEAPTIAPENLFEIVVNGEVTQIDLSLENGEFDCVTLNIDFPTQILFPEGSGRTIRINNETLEDELEAEVMLEEINAESRIPIGIDGKTYYLRSLPSDFPVLRAEGESPYGGYYYTTLTGYVIKMDAYGDVVFYRKAVAHHAGPFRRIDLATGTIYTYLEMGKFPDAVKMNGVGYVQTSLKILDEEYMPKQTIETMVQTEIMPAGYPMENHDYMILAENHYILSTYLNKVVDNIPADVPNGRAGAQVVASVIQEVKDGEVIFEWDSTAHPELYALSVEANDYQNEVSEWSDYVHFNSITIDPEDGNFVCSFRHLDAILKIDRTTGDILWILGGKGDQFGIGANQKFHRQHDLSILEDGSYMLFDNGALNNVYPYPVQSEETRAALAELEISRALIFELDEENMTVTGYRELFVPGYFSPTQGSATMVDISNDVVLMGWGSREDKINNPIFSEIDFENNETLFAMYHDEGTCYRVLKFDY